ncbi:MAG: hypothetical protein J5780_00090, partial [Treponema sp.]|nr:hypothetical protein [Treponema sp.]
MKKIISAVFLALFIQAHGFLFSEAALSEPEDAALEEYMTSLSPSALVSQIFLVNIEGSSSYYTVERSGDIFPYFGDEPLIPGGALFFSYNIADSAEKIIQFTESEKLLAERFSLVPPYNAVDQEGGYVNRLKEITSPLPSNRKVSSSLSPSQAF